MATNNSINTYEVPTAARERTMPLQSAFVAYNNTLRTNVTGDNTNYTVIFEVEDVDQNGDYDHTTGVFTAPVTGFYMLTASVQMIDLAAAHTKGNLFFNRNSGTDTFSNNRSDYGAIRELITSNSLTVNINEGVYLTAADTVSVTLDVVNGAKVVDIPAGRLTTFSAVLLF